MQWGNFFNWLTAVWAGGEPKMKADLRGTLKGQLRLWTILFVLVPALLVMGIYTFYQLQEARREKLAFLSQQVFFQERLISDWLTERTAMVRHIARLTAHAPAEQQMRRQFQLVEQSRPGFASLSYLDKNGTLKVFTGRQPPLIDPLYFQAALAGRESVSDLIAAPAGGGEPVIIFYAPAYSDDGTVQGVVAALAAFSALAETIHGKEPERAGETFLINREGVAFAEPRYADMLIAREPAKDDAFTRPRPGADGTAVWVDELGYKVLGAYRVVPASGWTIISRIQENAILAPVYTRLIWAAGGILLILLVMLLLTVPVINRLKHPLEWLIKQANFVAAENYDRVRLERFDGCMPQEMRILCETFVAMTRKIETTVGLLKAQQAQLVEAQQIARVGSWEWTMDSGHLRCSEQTRMNLGLTAGEIPSTISALMKQVYPDDRQRLAYAFAAGRKQENHSTEFRVSRADGTEGWLYIQIHTLFDEHSHPSVLYGTLQDITERKINEEQLRHYAAELEESNKEIKDFAYSVSHDLREPLVNLQGFSRELANSLTDLKQLINDPVVCKIQDSGSAIATLLEDEVPEALQFIHTAADQMDRMLTSLLKLSILGQRDLNYEYVDMDALVGHTLQSFGYQIQEKGIRVLIGPLPQFVTDRLAMEQVVRNLVDNAIKFLLPDRSGEFGIYCTDNGDEFIFSVEDNGRGIAAKDRQKIFEIFRRVGPQDVPGEGMGLAYVKTVIRQLGGTVWCQSEAGLGTTIHFTVPKKVFSAVDDAKFN